jgi:type 1 glutamine amidotransferase
VVVHGASYGFSGLDVLGDGHVPTGLVEAPWPEFIQLVGGIWSKANPETSHGDRHSFKVEFRDTAHPVTRGMGDFFWATDELYHNLKMTEAVHVLATAFSSPETRGTGEDEPILWTVDYGKGRVFQTVLGHDLVAMAEPGFEATFARGCEWSATGKVTLPAQLELNSRDPNALRVLVVTGGHPFQSEFYTLFESRDLVWDHATSNEAAFAEDLRERYDVVLLYDLSPSLSEAARSNVTRFLESNKGLVILHHALADYNDWPWWWQEVVGGRYILDNSDGHGSTFQQGVEMFVRPVAKHPIVAGLSPLHHIDEAYKRMWYSPDIQVLLQADVPESDGPVAWVSPYEKSRVVAIQLGHDRQVYLYPGFRDLIHRALMWTGKR